ENQADQSNDDHDETNRAGTHQRSCFALLLAQVLKHLCNRKAKRDERLCCSHPGDARALIRQECALISELHSGISLRRGLFIDGHSYFSFAQKSAQIKRARISRSTIAIELCWLSGRSENRAPPTAGRVEAFG